jgi:hypothetical protein
MVLILVGYSIQSKKNWFKIGFLQVDGGIDSLKLIDLWAGYRIFLKNNCGSL